ncbi:MAG: hypothetical protein ISN28_05955 [Ectothiorhodospiraceae bacterium AqS1]|nr:hypothetical protein [Ectothiorhodospiraceae bacterium AqS1]
MILGKAGGGDLALDIGFRYRLSISVLDIARRFFHRAFSTIGSSRTRGESTLNKTALTPKGQSA